MLDRLLGETKLERRFAIHFLLSRAWILGSFWLIFLLRKGFSLVDAATMDVIFWLTVLILEIPTGFIADWFGRKASVSLAFVVQSISIFMFAIADTYLEFLASYAIIGAGLTLQSGAEEAWLYDEVLEEFGSAEPFQRIYGRMIAIGLVSSAVSGYSSGIIAERSLVWTIYSTGIVFSIAAIWVLFIPQSKNEKQQEEKPKLSDGFYALNNQKLTLIVILATFTTGILISMIFWFQLYLDHSNIRFIHIGVIISTGGIIMALGSKYSSNISKLTGVKGLFLFLAIMSISLIAMSLGVIVAIIAYQVIHLFRGFTDPLFSRIINAEIPSNVRATSLSIISALSTIIIFSFEFGTALLIEGYGFAIFYITIGTILILVVGIIYVAMVKLRHIIEAKEIDNGSIFAEV